MQMWLVTDEPWGKEPPNEIRDLRIGQGKLKMSNKKIEIMLYIFADDLHTNDIRTLDGNMTHM